MPKKKTLDDVVITEIDSRNEAYLGHDSIVKLKKARVLVNGSDVLAQFVLGSMVGLGIGSIYLMDNRRIRPGDRYDFLCPPYSHSTAGNMKAVAIEQRLRMINPDIYIKGICSRFSGPVAESFMAVPDIIIDATNSVNSKKNAFRYCLKKNIPLISVSSDDDIGIVSCYHPSEKDTAGEAYDRLDTERYGINENHQGSYTSAVAGGLAVEELRKNLFKTTEGDADDPMGNSDLIVYNPCSSNKNSLESDLEDIRMNYFADKNALVVGAGAVGNFVVINLGQLGFGNIDIIDNDDIEITNLNRQIGFRTDDVGKSKAEVLSKRMIEISKGSVNPFIKWFESSDEYLFSKGNGHGRYDLVFSCVDRWGARELLNEYAVRHSVPLIEGGCSPTAGRVAYYVPGKTRCLECTKGLSALAENERKASIGRESSCVQQANPSIVMPNVIVAGLMVGEAKRILYSDNPGELVQGQIGFSSFSRHKLGIVPLPAYINDHICQGQEMNSHGDPENA